MRILDELVRQGKISELQMRAINALNINIQDDLAMRNALAQYGINDEDIVKARASAYNLGVIKVANIDPEVKDKLPREYILENKVMPIKTENGSLVLGMVDPEHNDIINAIRLEMLKIGYPYKLYLLQADEFDSLYKANYMQKMAEVSLLKQTPSDVEKQIQMPVSNINNNIMSNTERVLAAMQTAQNADVKHIAEEVPQTPVVEAPAVPEEVSVAEKIKAAQDAAVKTTKEQEGVTFAGLVNKAMSDDEGEAPTVAENQKAREEILSEEDILDITDNDGNLERLQSSGDGSAVDEINTILRYSINNGASDIHIEHAGEYTRVRVRVDGELKEIAAFGKSMHAMIVARIKILSGMRLDEKRKPQDGRFSVLLNSHKIDFRVSTMPGYYGEKIVMRILDSYRGIRKLEDIGFSERHLEQIREALHKPYGMVLISGPTGSGKTTTLYSMLNEIDRKSKNVVSLEDPIEYNVPSMNQSQVFPEIGYTFASGLRSILRQDPDVIMVGEIRDSETAQLAVQAALTGHLVFSTIHTNNSVGVITRLIDMNVDPFLIAPTLNLAIAQRLARQIADGSQEQILDNPGIEKIVEEQFADLPKEYKDALNLKRPLHSAKATADSPTGMKGRVPVLEILEMDKDIQRAIIDRKNEEEIWKLARAKGMITMKEDAIMKSMDGKIPFVEINNL